MRTLGLSMIVKNEVAVLPRLLASVAPLLDYWVVVDTGSTDGTQALVEAFFKERGIPGELLSFEWTEDFSAARNHALLAVETKADYGFWIDADEELILPEGFDKQRMLEGGLDSYSLTTEYGGLSYARRNLWRTGRHFCWQGPVHELLSSPVEGPPGVVEGVKVVVRCEGSSWASGQAKYATHARILAKHCERDPGPRWVFYTAQSYRDAGDASRALEWYARRAGMFGGFAEEQYLAALAVAQLSDALGKDKATCIARYLDAHALDPTRGEALKHLTQMFIRHADWHSAYIFSSQGVRYYKNSPYPNRVLFLDAAYYDFEALEIHSLACFYSGHQEEGCRAYWRMRAQLDLATVPEHVRNRIMGNEPFYPHLSVDPVGEEALKEWRSQR